MRGGHVPKYMSSYRRLHEDPELLGILIWACRVRWLWRNVVMKHWPLISQSLLSHDLVLCLKTESPFTVQISSRGLCDEKVFRSVCQDLWLMQVSTADVDYLGSKKFILAGPEHNISNAERRYRVGKILAWFVRWAALLIHFHVDSILAPFLGE
jgi:hypothetical protein